MRLLFILLLLPFAAAAQKDTVVLQRSDTLGEVIVNTGYEQLPRERATGSFEKISATLLNRNTSSNLLERLEGVSSLYFDRRSNGNAGILLRGRSTLFGNADLLIVVDNVPYDGLLENINPNDIESITILKDAAAASIWGVRAGNGVIVVTTKKGQYGKKPVVEYSGAMIIGEKPDLWYAPTIAPADFIDAERMLFDKGFYNGDINNTTSRPPLSPVVELLLKRRNGQISAADSANGINALKTLDARNDLDNYFYRNSFEQQHQLAVSGGATNFYYRISASYNRSESYLIKNSNERYGLRSQFVYKPIDRLEISLTTSYTDAKHTSNSSSNTSVAGSKKLYPYAQLADAAGHSLAIIKDYRLGYVDTAGGGKLLDWQYRPLDELSLSDNHGGSSEWRINTSVKYKFTAFLSAELLYQYGKQTTSGRSHYRQDSYTARNLINRFYNPAATNKYGVPLGGILDIRDDASISRSARAQLNFRRSWRKYHDITALAGAEIKNLSGSSYSFRTYGYSEDVLTTGSVNYSVNLPIYNNLASAQPVPNPTNFSESSLRYVSVFANAAYTFRGKFTVSASARKDASNIFGVNTNQKWVPLWSAGFAWKVIPSIKLRTSFGYNGNTDNTLSAYTTIMYTSGAMFTSLPYARVSNPPNPELRWEKQSVLNFGADFHVVNDRISGNIDYYFKKADDLIGESPVELTTGLLSPQGTFSFRGNVAAIKGRGLELQLTTVNLQGPFQWTSDLLFNYVSNKVSRYFYLPANASAYVNSSGVTVNPIPGKPLYTIYSYRWAGLDPQTGDPQGYLNQQLSKNYTSLVNVPISELNYHGSAIPTVFGSLRNTFHYKQLSLSFNLTYQLGYYFRRSSISYNSLFTNWSGHSDYALRWQQPGDEQFTNVPSLVYPNPSNRDNFYNNSSALVEKGDHIRLRDIVVMYELKKMHTQLSFYINNVSLLWKANKAGIDPDYYSLNGFPLPRTYSIGVKTSL